MKNKKQISLFLILLQILSIIGNTNGMNSEQSQSESTFKDQYTNCYEKLKDICPQLETQEDAIQCLEKMEMNQKEFIICMGEGVFEIQKKQDTNELIKMIESYLEDIELQSDFEEDSDE